jgi:hypothetical protein
VRGKTALLLGLAIVVALTGIWVVACGGGSGADGKATMRAALDTIEKDMTDLQAAMLGGGTVADLKTKKAELAPHWQAVIDACKGVEGADAAKAQQVWDDLDTALTGVADNASLMELAAAVMGPVTALQTYEKELRALVGGGTDTSK